ncbi:Gastric cancer antigen Zg14-like protein [Harpegnathos saltator]|uniref:Gastric cancer antigen Zg14-like protein n=2 Tax=Harpegnathos saltator TaxID=610380 RepID=E2C571_HARSA|nr:Gastric cancer antigen Zg14-like protein [Harpegnathos saltator]
MDSTNKHELFIKEHSVRNQELKYPKNQTLFVFNVPPYATTDSLKYAFAEYCGNVRSVTFTNAKGFKTAYIVFETESSLDKAMELSKDCVITLNNDRNIHLIGLEKWSKEYNDSICDEQITRREIEEYMALYDKSINDRVAREKDAEDDDGWTTVTGRKKRGQFAPSRKESTIGKLLQKEKQSKKKKQLVNFYTFQIREAKKQNLAELRKKFELDKKKLQELKLKRTFKPF